MLNAIHIAISIIATTVVALLYLPILGTKIIVDLIKGEKQHEGIILAFTALSEEEQYHIMCALSRHHIYNDGYSHFNFEIASQLRDKGWFKELQNPEKSMGPTRQSCKLISGLGIDKATKITRALQDKFEPSK